MREDIQLAVVGAGPAGSTAAQIAARDLEVVLIDRKNEIGSPVQCGGFLPEAQELEALLPRARLPETLRDIPEHCILHRTGLQRIYSPSGKSKEFAVAGRVLDRRAFDRYLGWVSRWSQDPSRHPGDSSEWRAATFWPAWWCSQAPDDNRC